jgi:hypothetical protein
MQFPIFKNFVLVVVLACTAMLTSCTKDPILVPETIVNEQWTLLDMNWSVTINSAATTTLQAIPASGATLNANSIFPGQLPLSVINRLRDDKISINQISEAWAITGGGFILKVQQYGAVSVYWFKNGTDIKSIGTVAI